MGAAAPAGPIRQSLRLLQRRDRRRLGLLAALQGGSALLDLAGVLLFGLVALVAASAQEGAPLPDPVQRGLALVGLAGEPAAVVCVALAAAAAVFLVARSAASLAVMLWVNRFLADRATEVTADLTRRFLAQPLLSVQHHPSQWSAYGLTRGVLAATTGVLGSAIALLAELCLLVVLGGALLLIDPVVTVIAGLYFALVSVGIQRTLTGPVWAAATEQYEADIASQTAVQDAVATFREVSVAHRLGHYRDLIVSQRQRAARARAKQTLAVQLPRYGMEAALVIGAAGLAGALLLTRDVEQAVASLALFLTAGSRIMPSLLRLNSSRIAIRSAAGEAEATFELAADLPQAPEEDGSQPRGEHDGSVRTAPTDTRPAAGAGDAGSGQNRSSAAGRLQARAEVPVAPEPHVDLTEPRRAAELALADVWFRYPGQPDPAVAAVAVALPAGGSLAVVGPSGAGKSTLADIILGVITPDTGTVRIAGRAPAELIRQAPGSLAYVPQDVALVHGTVRDNVALGVAAADVDDAAVWRALERAHVADMVQARDGLDTVVGERGVRLSGGQRQRLGLARALFSEPRLLVLDEATSALDAETEHAVAQTLASLTGRVTTVTIAHRLATVRRADVLLYLAAGQLVAAGTFDEVRAAVPDFDRQAELLGL